MIITVIIECALVNNRTKSFHFHFDLFKDFDKNFKHEIESTIRHYGYFAKQRIKTRLTNYCTTINMETIFETSEPHKFVFSLPQRLDLKKRRQIYCSSKLIHLLLFE